METYAQFVDRCPELPVFYQPGWLDAVVGTQGWGFSASYDGLGRITGVWPFQHARKWKLLPILQTPPMSFQLGPWIEYPDGMKRTSRYDWEWKILGELADGLPKNVLAIYSKAPYRLKNWLPLERRGWRQTTRYSYVHPAEWDQSRRWREMAGRQRTAIRKAEEKLTIQVEPDLAEVYRLVQLTFRHRGERLPLPYSTLVRVHDYLQSTQQGAAYTVVDAAGRAHAAGYLAWDQRNTYNLIQGSDPEHRKSGAPALGLWWASAQAADKGLAFDFEGSHIPGVEKFYRGLGGELRSYYQLSRDIFRIS